MSEKSNLWISRCFLTSVVFVLTMPTVAVAQIASTPTDDASGTLVEIVVTAQKVEQRILDTPLAITAVSGRELERAQISELDDLNNSMPNVSIENSTDVAHITIRGIGITDTQPGSVSAVAYHIDGVYVSRPEAQLDSFFDVDRMEVVRGPQGVLYGRNATAGAINVITRDPTDEYSGYGEVTYGAYNEIATQAAVSGPITNGVSARLAVQTMDRGGYGSQGMPDHQATAYNGPPDSVGYSLPLDDKKTQALRLKIKLEPTNTVKILISADYFHEDDAAGLLTYLRPGDAVVPPPTAMYGGVLPADTYRDTYNSVPQSQRRNDSGLSVTTTWSYSPEFNLTSVTGYRHVDLYKGQNDYAGTQFTDEVYWNDATSDQYSEELRASGKVDSLTYVGGLYAFTETQHMLSRALLKEVGICATFYIEYTNCPTTNNDYFQGYAVGGDLTTNAYAAFGQVSYEFTDQFGVDLGGRYSDEIVRKPIEIFSFDVTTPYNPALPLQESVTPPTQASFHAFTPKASLRYKPTEDLMAYFTYAKGFKSGGYNIGSSSPPYLPEQVRDFELGLKGEWLQKRLLADFSIFDYSYTDLQVSKLNSTSTALEVVSAGKAKIYGAEASIAALPIESLRLDFNIGLLHARYDVFSQVNTALFGPGNFYGIPGAPLAGVLQNLHGNDLVQAPNYNANLGAEYTWREGWGQVALRGEEQFVGKTYFTVFNTDAFAQTAYSLTNAYLRYQPLAGNWYANLWAKNVANKTYLEQATPTSALGGSWVLGYAGPPRTYGISVVINF